jgi:hypothetical protein
MRNAFGSGMISRRAVRDRFDFGTTSDNPVPLRPDDGGLRQTGSVRADHAVDREHNVPRRGTGFDNPPDARDFGPPDQIYGRDHIDARRAVDPKYPAGAGYTPQPDRRGPGASVGRARAGSASEYWSDEWYGTPERRQE